MRRAYTIGAPSIFVNKNRLGRYPEFGTRGSEVQILSPRPFLFSNLQNGQVMRVYTKGFTLTRLTARGRLQVPPMYCRSVRDAKRLRPYTQAGGKVTRWSLGAQAVLAPTYRRKMDGSKAVGQRGSVAMLACFSIPFTSP
jgi:hypothetical protein